MFRKLINIIRQVNLAEVLMLMFLLVLLLWANLTQVGISLITYSSIYILLVLPICAVPIYVPFLVVKYFKTEKSYTTQSFDLSSFFDEVKKFARFWYPWIFGVIVYENLTYLTAGMDLPLKNELLIQIDNKILGFQVSEFLQYFMSPILTQYLFLIYMLGYVLLPPLLGIMLYYLKSKNVAYRYMLTVLFAMYIGYTTYLIVPAIGPEEYCPGCYMNDLYGNLNFRGDEIIHNIDSYPKNAFPSLHMAMSVIVLIFSFKFNKKIGLLVLLITISIGVATLYLRMHYFIDIVAGVVLAVFCYALSPFLNERWKRFRESTLIV